MYQTLFFYSFTVNVTKTFMDMKQIERSNEREAFLLARKLRKYSDYLVIRGLEFVLQKCKHISFQ